MIKSVLRLGLILMLTLLPITASAIEPQRSGQEDMLMRAVYTGDRLWLLSDAGQLFSLTETDTQSRREQLGEPVHDMCVLDGQLMTLTATRDKPRSWNLRHYAAQVWTSGVTITTYGEALVALLCEGKSVLIVTDKRLITVSNDQTSEVALKGQMSVGIASTLATDTAVYIGFNQGEWGGGLQRIDRATGQISQIEDTGKGCGSLLNTNCDPVNGLAVLPWRTDCIAVAVGLMHRYGHGQIVTVCGDRIEKLYVKQYGERYANETLPPEEAYPTIPFYGLMPVGDRLLAVGADGLYRLSADGKATFEKLPAFKKIGPFHVSFAVPDIVLVLTLVNQRRSMSGPAPMLVAR